MKRFCTKNLIRLSCLSVLLMILLGGIACKTSMEVAVENPNILEREKWAFTRIAASPINIFGPTAATYQHVYTCSNWNIAEGILVSPFIPLLTIPAGVLAAGADLCIGLVEALTTIHFASAGFPWETYTYETACVWNYITAVGMVSATASICCVPQLIPSCILLIPLPGCDAVPDTVPDVVQTAEIIAENTAEQINDQAIEQAAEQAVEKITERTLEQIAAQSAEQITIQVLGQITAQTLEQIAIQTVKQIAIHTVEQVAVQAAEKINAQTAEEIAVEVIKRIAVHTAKQFNEQTAGQIAVQAARKINEQTAEQIAVQAVDQIKAGSAGKIAVQTAEKIAVQAAEQGYISLPSESAVSGRLKDTIQNRLEHFTEE